MSPPPTAGLKRAPLDVYKKVTIIRKPDDSIVYEDSQGRVQCITDLGDAALAATPSLQPKVKLDIPVPNITVVESYNHEIPDNYAISLSYTRFIRPTAAEIEATVEYNVDDEDETWLENHPRFGTKLNDYYDPDDDGGRDSQKSTSIVVNDPSVKAVVTAGDNNNSVSNFSKKNKKISSKANATTKGASDKITTATHGSSCIHSDNTNAQRSVKSDTMNSTDPTTSKSRNEGNTNMQSSDPSSSSPQNQLTLPRPVPPRKRLQRRPTLPLTIFESMLDLFEKATKFNTIITKSQAERLTTQRIPQILHLFGSSNSCHGPYNNNNGNNSNKNYNTLVPATAVSTKTTTKKSTNTNNNISTPSINSNDNSNVKTTTVTTSGATRGRRRSSLSTNNANTKKSTASTTSTTSTPANSSSNNNNKNKRNSATLRSVIGDVYDYWVQKRSRRKKPLLRRYWPVTSCDDTNPHLVFRPREKEKYKLRKKRQVVDDLDAYRKMKQLKVDFEKLRSLLELVQRRERIQQLVSGLMDDWFDGRVYDMVDTSGLPRVSDRLGTREEIDALINEVPKYFDTQDVYLKGSGGGGKRKKRRRSSLAGSGGGGGREAKSSSPTPLIIPSSNDYQRQRQQKQKQKQKQQSQSQQPQQSQQHHATYTSSTSDAATTIPTSKYHQTQQQKQQQSKTAVVVADQSHPPLYFHPLKSRESYVASWDDAVPFVDSYVNSHPTPTFRFRHRPRVGRGGRVVIDRLPRPGNPNIPPMDVFRTTMAATTTIITGEGRHLPPRDTTTNDKTNSKVPTPAMSSPVSVGDMPHLDLLPRPLDRDTVRRKIEDIAASALEEDDNRDMMLAMSSGGYTSGGGGGGGSSSGKNLTLSSSVTLGGGGSSVDDKEGADIVEGVVVPLNDWLETDEQLWGEERLAIGPV